MPIQDIQALIDAVKCELRETSLFTEDDLSALDFCTPETNPLVPTSISDVSLPAIHDVLPCVTELSSVIDQAKDDLSKAMQIKITEAKVQELYDNLNLVGLYYQTRYETFNTYAVNSTILVTQKNTLNQQLSKIPKTDKSAQAAIQAKIADVDNKMSQLQKKADILSDKNFNPNDFLKSNAFINSVTNTFHTYCANTSSANFDPIQVQAGTGGISFNFVLNIPQLRKYAYKDPTTKADQTVDIVGYLKNKKLFDNTPVFKLFAYEDKPLPNKVKLTDTYNSITGLLYDNTKNPGQYPGLYWKLQAPLDRLFTLDERGLTADPTQIDPVFDADAAAATIQDQTNDTKYYIKDVNKYQDFYKDLQKHIDERIQHERDVVFSDAIKNVTDVIKQAANRDALYALRLNGFLQNTIPNLKVTVSVDSANSITVDTTKLDTTKGTLSSVLDKFRAMSEEINNKLKDCQTEIDNLSTNAAGLLVTQDSILDRINNIPCFAPQPDLGDCGDLAAALGSDPLGANMIANGTGPTSAYPDLSSMCYWKEFAKCATLVNLIPLPGDNFVNPFKLRYWPIGLWIPTPVMVIHIPLPHIWLPIFCVSTPIGTLVIFIGLCGIVPSPFLFFISPTGTKSFVLSLSGPQQEIGYKGDSTIKGSLRLPNPFSDVQKVLNTNFPFNASEIGIPLGSDADDLSLLDNSESVTGYMNEYRSKAIKQLDSIGDLPMTNFNLARVGGNLNSLTLDKKIDIIKSDMFDAIDSLILGSFTVPRDQGKLRIKQPALSTVNDLFKGFASTGDKLSDDTHFSVKHIISQFVTQVDNGITLPKTALTKDETKIEKNIKDKLKAFNASMFSIATGHDTVPLSTDDLRFNDRETIVAGAVQKQANEQFYVSMLSNTVQSILAGATLDLFNPFKKCCQAKAYQLPGSISPIALVVLNASKLTIDQIIEALSNSELQMIEQIGYGTLGEIKSIYDSIILSKFPDLQIPSNVNIFNFSTIMAFISPVLGAITIPQVPLTSLVLFPAAITFEIDGIAKAAIRNIASSAKSITSVLNLNLDTQFAQLTSNDIKSALKKFINTSVDNVQSKLSPILKPIQAIRGSNGASKTILEAAFPIMNILAEAKAVAKSLQKNSSTIEFVDLAKLAELASGELKVAQKIFSNGGSYIPIIILAALGLDKQARLVHPLFDQDDLPPWERLTVKNPLFVLFLDEFCSQAAECTSVILGRTWPQ